MDPGGPALRQQVISSRGLCNTPLSSNGLTGSNREICQALVENKEVGEQRRPCVCVREDVMGAVRGSRCSNVFDVITSAVGPPVTTAHLVLPPLKSPRRLQGARARG